VIYVVEAKEVTVEEDKESYRVVFSKALLGKCHVDRQEGDAVKRGFYIKVDASL